MSKEDEPKPSDQARKKQPPKAGSSHGGKASDDFTAHLSELVTILRASNLPAAAERQERLEVKLNELIQSSEDRSKSESERAEREEKRYSRLEQAHNELAAQLKQITAVLPRIESIHTSFADVSSGVQALNTNAQAISSEIADLKTHAEGTQLSLTGLYESVSEVSAGVKTVDSAISAVLDKAQVLHEEVTSGQVVAGQQLELFSQKQALVVDGISGLSKVMETLATRDDISVAVEHSGIKTRRTIKAVGVVAHKEGKKALAEQTKRHSKIVTRTAKAVLMNVDKYGKMVVQKVIDDMSSSTKELTTSTKEFTSAVTKSTEEIQESKSVLRAGSNAIVKAQNGLLEIGPFAENQISASMNHVVTTVAPQITNHIKGLIESSGLNKLQALANQLGILLDETDQNIDSIRKVGEQVVASNNHNAASNSNLVKELEVLKASAEALESRLDSDKIVESSRKIELYSKVFTSSIEAYKGAFDRVFEDLTKVLVDRFSGQVDDIISQSKMSEHEKEELGRVIAEITSNMIMTQVYDDSRKDA